MYDSIVSSQPGGKSEAILEKPKSTFLEISPLDPTANGGASLRLKEQAGGALSSEDIKDNRKEELLDRIASKLAVWALLYDVPFCYLLPNQALLPMNSVRFFYLDPNWVFSLADGALSPGRTTDFDFLHDRILAGDAYRHAMSESEKVRRILQGRPPPEPVQNELPGNKFTPMTCTGFLMRSPLVTNWRGLEFEAYDINGNSLRALRIETLSHDVLLALFLGEIDNFVLTEPPEGLHYGVDWKADAQEKNQALRDLDSGKVQKGAFGMAANKKRVINFAETSEHLKTALNREADSAIMALQLTRAGSKLKVRVKSDNGKG